VVLIAATRMNPESGYFGSMKPVLISDFQRHCICYSGSGSCMLFGIIGYCVLSCRSRTRYSRRVATVFNDRMNYARSWDTHLHVKLHRYSDDSFK
jgi:hypothetical protein